MKFNDGYFPQLAHSSEVESLVVDAAEQVASAARAGAPVDTGAYRDGIEVRVTQGRSRVVARVVASAEDSMLVESQTGNLARALRSVTRSG